jgi:hypothetical protein
MKSHGITPRTSPSIGTIMASHSKNYLTGDASRSQSTPTTCSPPNDAFRLLTIVDGRCFACKQLWEDTTKPVWLSSKMQLTRMHTPDILTHLLCNSMDSWLAQRPMVVIPARNGPEEPIQKQIRQAFMTEWTLSRIVW